MKICKIFLAALPCLLLGVSVRAQNPPQTPEQREKQMTEFIDKEVKRLTDMLELEYWQEFYVDSTLNHDLRARQAELLDMQKARVENSDLYMAISDKWMEPRSSGPNTGKTAENAPGKSATREKTKSSPAGYFFYFSIMDRRSSMSFWGTPILRRYLTILSW